VSKALLILEQKTKQAGSGSKAARALLALALSGAGLLLAGCGGPTYGTGKTSGQQLADDFSNITRWKSLSSNKNVDTKPRPELIQPTKADLSTPLPAPQEAVARPDNPDWPESPEQRRERLRKEATENRNNPKYVSPIIQDDAPQTQRYLPTGIDRAREREDNMPSPAVTKKQAARYKELQQEEAPAEAAKTRKYLSDPPLEYLKPSPNAPTGDLGESEEEKERKTKGGKTSIFGK